MQYGTPNYAVKAKPDRITQMLEESAKNAVTKTISRFREHHKMILLQGNGLVVSGLRLTTEMSFPHMLESCIKFQKDDVWASMELSIHHMGAYEILSLSALRMALEEIIAESL